ncbi:hypothetical protein vseg_020595 [Gypsophila vaccaria]
MTKIPSLRRILLPCCTTFSATHPTTPTTTTTTHPTTAKKRLSTSLRDDTEDPTTSTSSTTSPESVHSHAPPRPSKSMVICTFFGPRRGSHVYFCVQLDRRSSKPALLLELSISIHNLVREMRSGLVRIALESKLSDLSRCPLHSIPVWTVFCNGRRAGFAARRKASRETKSMLDHLRNMTVGAGVIPASGGDHHVVDEEVLYMRANYEWSVGGADVESFHLVSPEDSCPGQELSVFLLRSSST